MFKFLVISIFLGCAAANNNDRFCDPSLCRSGNQHVACGHSGDFHESCPPDRHMVPLSATEIQLVLNTHNTVRNRIAGGEEHLSPASRMATMVNYFLQ